MSSLSGGPDTPHSGLNIAGMFLHVGSSFCAELSLDDLLPQFQNEGDDQRFTYDKMHPTSYPHLSRSRYHQEPDLPHDDES
jgi:hypothetical protein